MIHALTFAATTRHLAVERDTDLVLVHRVRLAPFNDHDHMTASRDDLRNVDDRCAPRVRLRQDHPS